MNSQIRQAPKSVQSSLIELGETPLLVASLGERHVHFFLDVKLLYSI